MTIDPKSLPVDSPTDVPKGPAAPQPEPLPPLANEHVQEASFPGTGQPTEHPVHQVPEHLPRPPGDLPPGEQPAMPPQPQLAERSGSDPYEGKVENEHCDPIGKPPRL
jgi:hypothetical protein